MIGRIENENKIEMTINKKLETMPEYVKSWHYNLKASKKTASTRKAYITYIHDYLNNIDKDIDKIELKKINYNSLVKYFISIQTKNIDGEDIVTSDSYQQTIWCTLNSFVKFLHKQKLIEENYMELIEKPKNKDLDRINMNRVLLTETDFKKILNDVKDNEPLSLRDRAILLLFMTTGMRKTALQSINVSDVDFENGKLKVIDKGNKIHLYELNTTTLNALEKWIDIRSYVVNYDDTVDALFVNYQGKRISGNGLSKIVEKHCENAIGKSLSPHKLRAGFCSIMYKKTKNIEFVRRAVGHSNVATTQRYIVTNGEEKKKASELMNNLL